MHKFHHLIGIFQHFVTAVIIFVLNHPLEVLHFKVMAAVTFIQINDFRLLCTFQPYLGFGADRRRAVYDDISVIALQLTDILTCGIFTADTAGQEPVVIKYENPGGINAIGRDVRNIFQLFWSTKQTDDKMRVVNIDIHQRSAGELRIEDIRIFIIFKLVVFT